ncbi:1556_t:CDS:2, partial [Entrophospora sp. SA101]
IVAVDDYDGDESGVYDVPNNQNRKSLSRSSLIIGRSESLILIRSLKLKDENDDNSKLS